MQIRMSFLKFAIIDHFTLKMFRKDLFQLLIFSHCVSTLPKPLLSTPNLQTIWLEFEVNEEQPFVLNLKNDLLQKFKSNIGAIEFSSEHSSWYTIDSNGILRVEPIDREDALLCRSSPDCLVTFDVLLWRDVHPADLRVVLRIRDLNDNRPRWPTATLHLAIAENAPPNSALSDTFPEAIDADAGDNGITGYRLTRCELFAPNTRRQQLLAIDECPLQLRPAANSKPPRLVAVQSLDRETVAEVRLIVRAFEGGNQPDFADLQVVVMVTDLNDNTPEFPERSMNFSIRENIMNWRYHFMAADADEGLNGEIVYSLTSDRYCASHFELSNVTGALMLVKPLNFEQQSNCSFTIRAADRGTPSLASSIRVFIRVVDVNDNEPVVQVVCEKASGRQERPVTVREEAAAGTPLSCHLLVTDADTGAFGDVDCEFDSTSRENFLLTYQNSRTFTIATRRPLDRETKQMHQLLITCADNANLRDRRRSSVHIFLKLEDLNDNTPTVLNVSLSPTLTLFQNGNVSKLDCTKNFSECSLEIPENNPSNEQILLFSATDPDEGIFHYTITVAKMLIYSNSSKLIIKFNNTRQSIMKC